MHIKTFLIACFPVSIGYPLCEDCQEGLREGSVNDIACEALVFGDKYCIKRNIEDLCWAINLQEKCDYSDYRSYFQSKILTYVDADFSYDQSCYSEDIVKLERELVHYHSDDCFKSDVDRILRL